MLLPSLSSNAHGAVDICDDFRSPILNIAANSNRLQLMSLFKGNSIAPSPMPTGRQQGKSGSDLHCAISNRHSGDRYMSVVSREPLIISSLAIAI